MEFKVFIGKFAEALAKKDEAFMKEIYADILASGIVPEDQKPDFFTMVFSVLENVKNLPLESTECFGDFCIAHFKGEDDSKLSFTFMKKGSSWVLFSERMNFSSFRKAYAINYVVDGEDRLKVLFNGKETPVLRDIGSSGVVTLINSALNVGENELTITPPQGKSIKVTIRISSGMEGEPMNSAQGDVLSWEGTVSEPQKLKFRAD
ncbi:MAG: hypothetical protein L0Y56_10820 [Nitrospira sp.]|nr:hypothetical protein [Nitrospira sp.]